MQISSQSIVNPGLARCEAWKVLVNCDVLRGWFARRVSQGMVYRFVANRARAVVSLRETCVNVSYMETEDSRDQPTQEEARAALATASTEEQATSNRPVPVWYYPVLAIALFALFALNSIDEATGTTRVVTVVLVLALGVGIAGLVGKISVNRPGYKGIHTPWGPTIPMMLLAAAFPIAAIALDDVLGSWVWIAAGAALAVLVLVPGVIYQRKHRHG